jgi:hypothetical protein
MVAGPEGRRRVATHWSDEDALEARGDVTVDSELPERITARRVERDEVEEQLAKQSAEVRAGRDELAVAVTHVSRTAIPSVITTRTSTHVEDSRSTSGAAACDMLVLLRRKCGRTTIHRPGRAVDA